MTQEELKIKFAEELFRLPDNPLKAALNVFGEENIPIASRMAIEWPKDEFVIQELNKLKVVKTVPSRDEVVNRLWELSKDRNVDPKDKVGALKVLAEVCGYIEQKGTKIDVNNVNNPKVMIVKDHGDIDEWERKLEDQQRKLVNG